MRTHNTFIAASAVALSLLAVTPALADSNNNEGQDAGSVRASAGLHIGSLARLFARDNNGNNQDKHDVDDSKDGDNRNASTTHAFNQVSGTVSAVNGNVITITKQKGNTTFSVNASGAAFVNGNGSTIALTDIKVGDFVSARGSGSGTAFTATTVRDFGAHVAPMKNNVGVIGTISSVNGSSFVVSPIGTSSNETVNVTSDTIFRGDASGSSDLTAGKGALVIGSSSSSTPGTITASIVVMFQDGISFFKNLFR